MYNVQDYRFERSLCVSDGIVHARWKHFDDRMDLTSHYVNKKVFLLYFGYF